MTAPTARLVPVWGFHDEELAAWPTGLHPAPLDPEAGDWSANGPCVVHLRGAETFVARALGHTSPSGALPAAILVVPEGESADPATRSDFDASVTLGDWAALRLLLAAPGQFDAAAVAEMVPRSFLAGWQRPLSELSPSDLPGDLGAMAGAWWEDRASRQAFLVALDNRLAFLLPWSGPQPADRAALRQWLRARPLPRLEQQASPDTVPPSASSAPPRDRRTGSAIVLAMLDTAAVALVEGLAAPVEWLAHALRPPQPGWLIMRGAISGQSRFRARGPELGLPSTEAEQEPPAAIDLTRHPRLRGTDKSISEVILNWQAADETLVVERVGTVATPLKSYGLAVRRGGRVVWEGRSDPETGRLYLSSAELARVMRTEPASSAPVELELFVEQP